MVPVLFVTVSPFVTVIAGMFAVSRLMAQNEVVPMLFTGRPIVRVLRPVLAMGVLSALMTAATWEFVVPYTTESLRSARLVFSGGHAGTTIDGIILKFDEGDQRRTLFCSRYDFERLRMEHVRLLRSGEGPADLVVLSADSATWNPEREEWELTGGKLLERDPTGESKSRETPQKTLKLPGLTPELLDQTAMEGRETMELSYSDLRLLQQLRPGRREYVLAFHAHITYALANVVLLLLSLPFAVHFERRSRVERVVMAVAVCAVYLVTDLICQRLGQSYLHPVLAAWIPTILFGSVGVASFSGVQS